MSDYYASCILLPGDPDAQTPCLICHRPIGYGTEYQSYVQGLYHLDCMNGLEPCLSSELSTEDRQIAIKANKELR